MRPKLFTQLLLFGLIIPPYLPVVQLLSKPYINGITRMQEAPVMVNTYIAKQTLDDSITNEHLSVPDGVLFTWDFRWK